MAGSANARLLSAGLARFAADPRAAAGEAGEVQEALRGCEEKARRGHVGMWRYGDPGEDSDQVRVGVGAYTVWMDGCEGWWGWFSTP